MPEQVGSKNDKSTNAFYISATHMSYAKLARDAGLTAKKEMCIVLKSILDRLV